jgi:hypothetical protein
VGQHSVPLDYEYGRTVKNSGITFEIRNFRLSRILKQIACARLTEGVARERIRELVFNLSDT